MYIFTYKLPNDDVIIDIYHNRAEVMYPTSDRKSQTFFLFDDIGEIMESIGLGDRIDELITV